MEMIDPNELIGDKIVDVAIGRLRADKKAIMRLYINNVFADRRIKEIMTDYAEERIAYPVAKDQLNKLRKSNGILQDKYFRKTEVQDAFNLLSSILRNGSY